MEDHVNWAEKMGARVLINDRWYKRTIFKIINFISYKFLIIAY